MLEYVYCILKILFLSKMKQSFFLVWWALFTGVRSSSFAPEQIGLNYGNDFSDMVVSWASWGYEKIGICHYGLTVDNLNMSASLVGN